MRPVAEPPKTSKMGKILLIALLVAVVFLARIGWKHFHKKKNA